MINKRFSSLYIKKQRIQTSNFRIQAQVLELPNSKLLWINAYLPTDPGTVDLDDDELLTVLNEIENILLQALFSIHKNYGVTRRF